MYSGAVENIAECVAAGRKSSISANLWVSKRNPFISCCVFSARLFLLAGDVFLVRGFSGGCINRAADILKRGAKTKQLLANQFAFGEHSAYTAPM
jgi:hypothetical protein